MSRTILRAVQLAVGPTALLVAALLLAPGRAGLAIHVYTLVLLTLALAAAVRAIARSQGDSGPSAFDSVLHRGTEERARLPELARIERATELGGSSAFDLHYRLRPLLRETAAGLLAVRRGVVLDAEPDRARALLGEDAWELVRLERRPPPDRFAPGIEISSLRRVVAALEAL